MIITESNSVPLDKCPALVLNADYRPLSYYPLSLWDLPSGNIDDKHAHIAQHVTLSFSGVELREGVRACKRACLCLGHRFALLANMESGKHVRFSVVHRTWLNGNGQCEYGFQGLGYCRFECAPDKPTGLEDEGF